MTYELSLEGKTALITAAGQGIGRASAEAFADAGALVIATDINETALTELERYDGITALKLDATKPEDIKRVLAEAGGLDVLFNCAGVEEAAEMLVWAVSPENSFTTGAVFDLSGGRSTYYLSNSCRLNHLEENP